MSLKVFVIAGEASGDQLGASLLRALRDKAQGDIEVRGIGGSTMLEEGLQESLFPMEELSVMGIAEILPRIPKFLRLMGKTVQAIRVFNPDVVITIDSPDFCFRVAEKLAKLGNCAKRIHYVAPTVWAWRAGRAAKIARFLDGIICLFPFEPVYFEKEGLKSCFAGHPVVASGLMEGDGARFREKHAISKERKILGLFCGSRRMEIENLAPVMIEVAQNFVKEYPETLCLLPTLPKWQEKLEAMCREAGLHAVVMSDPAEKWDAFRAPDVALAVSGTVGLEIALAGVPHAILYKMHPLTWELVKRLVKTRFAHLGNILVGHMVYPEFIQDNVSVENIIPALRVLASSSAERSIQIQTARNLRLLLDPDPNENAAERAAAFVMSCLKQETS